MQGINIADISFDVGDLSEFDSTINPSATTVTAAAALAGTRFGVELDTEANLTVQHKKAISWESTDVVRVRIHLDPNGIVLNTATQRRILSLLDGSNSNMMGLQIRDSTTAGNIQVRAVVQNDSAGFHVTSWIAIADEPHWIEMRVIRASSAVASDGSILLQINGAAAASVGGLDVFDAARPVDVGLEWTSPDAGDTGALYIDEIIVRNEDIEIGQVELSHLLTRAIANDGTSDEFDVFGGGGGLAVTQAAALAASSFGVEVTLGSAAISSAQKAFSRPWTSRAIRYRFHFDPNTVTLADTSLRRIADLVEAGVANRIEAHLHSDGGGGFEMAVRAVTDAGTVTSTAAAITDAEHVVEVAMKRSTSATALDGEIELWVDGELIASEAGLDIWDISRPNAARFIWGSGNVGDSGVVYIDEMEVRDTNGEIGSAVQATRGPLTIQVAGETLTYVDASCKKEDRIGATPGKFVFRTDDRPVEEGEVDVDIQWLDEAGNVNRTEKFFGGHILRVRSRERATSRQVRYEVHCSDFRHEAAFTLVTEEFTRGNVEDVLADLFELLPGGYTLDVDAGPEIGPYEWEDVAWPQAAAQACRDAGFIFWIDPNRVVFAKHPDSLDASFEINRDEPDGHWWKLEYDRAHGKIINSVRVYGDEGRLAVVESAASQDVHGRRPKPYRALNALNNTALATIGQTIIDAKRMPVVQGTSMSDHDRISVGTNTRIIDLSRRGVQRVPVRIEQAAMAQRPADMWHTRLAFTSERLLGELNPPPPTSKEIVRSGPVRNPTTDKSPGTGEYIVQVKYNVNTGQVTLRLSSDKSDNIQHGFRVVFEGASNLTVSRSLSGTDAGEDVEILDSGTTRVDIASTIDGDRHGGRWSIQNQTKSVVFTVTGDLEDAQMRLILRNGEVGGVDADEINGVFFGSSQVVGKRDMRRRIRVTINLSPSVNASAVNEDGNLSFVNVSYVDGNRRPNKLRRASNDLDADDAYDKSADDTSDITEVAAREFVNGAYTDASRRPNLIRRSSENLSPDDISKADEVENNLGGAGEQDIFNAALSIEILDRQNEEAQNLFLLNNCDMGNPDGSEESTNVVRAGGVRGLETIDSQFRLSAYITEGITGAREGGSTWGIQWSGDGSQLTASSGTGESGDGSGDSGGGDIIP